MEQTLYVNDPSAFLNRTQMLMAEDEVPRRILACSLSLVNSLNHYRFYFPYRQNTLVLQYLVFFLPLHWHRYLLSRRHGSAVQILERREEGKWYGNQSVWYLSLAFLPTYLLNDPGMKGHRKILILNSGFLLHVSYYASIQKIRLFFFFPTLLENDLY